MGEEISPLEPKGGIQENSVKIRKDNQKGNVQFCCPVRIVHSDRAMKEEAAQ